MKGWPKVRAAGRIRAGIAISAVLFSPNVAYWRAKVGRSDRASQAGVLQASFRIVEGYIGWRNHGHWQSGGNFEALSTEVEQLDLDADVRQDLHKVRRFFRGDDPLTFRQDEVEAIEPLAVRARTGRHELRCRATIRGEQDDGKRIDRGWAGR